jgi:hypothetical protein
VKNASREMQAVLEIFSYDEQLRHKALAHVDIERDRIDWKRVFDNDYGSGHFAAVVWAYCLWSNELTKTNPFDIGFSMDAGLRRRVLRALAIVWSIPMDNMNTLRSA